MRNRIVEIMAAVIGVALVVFFYLDRAGETESPAEPVAVPVEVPSDEPEPEVPVLPLATPAEPEPLTAEVEPLALDSPEVLAAQNAWETARAELEAVEAELEELDLAFDEKEAEFEELEDGGMDPEEIEDQMLVYLDSIIDQYDALETRLMEAEEAELEAAERLEAARRAFTGSGDSVP